MTQWQKHFSVAAQCCLIGICLGGCSSESSQPPHSPEEKAAIEAQEFLFTGNADMAIESYTKAIELNGRQAEYYLNRGLAQKLKMNHEAAIADFDKAIEMNPQMSAAYYNRGKVYELLGKGEKSQSDLETAERLSASR